LKQAVPISAPESVKKPGIEDRGSDKAATNLVLAEF
jgi:hypothetical protein